MGPIEDWKKGTGTWELRVESFCRRKTAERYVAWLKAQETDH